jgi:iron complex transport system substrate-binding protein
VSQPGVLKLLINASLLVSLALMPAAQGQSRDQLNNKNRTDPQRVITLAPHLAEIVAAAGGAERLIGVSAYSNYPDSVKNLPIISDARSVDLEKMKQLRPDLIIYWRGGMPETLIESIKKTFSQASNGREVQIISIEPKKLSDISQDIETIGKVLGTQAIANKNAKEFNAQIATLKSKYQSPNKRKVRVFYQVWPQPLMTLNQDHLITEIIHICGGEQLFAKEKLLVPIVSREAVVAANPEIIFTAANSSSMKVDWSMWTSIPQLDATKKKAFIVLEDDLISRPSPRVIQGAYKICSEIDNIR